MENHNFKLRREKLRVPVTSFGGYKDDIEEEEIKGWGEHTNQRFEYHMFEGGHFFIHSKEREITEIINRELAG